MAWADMRELANEHNFILVYPQGTPLDGVSHWIQDCRWGQQSTADDFGFILSLIESLSPHIVLIQTVFMPVAIQMRTMSYSLVCYHSEIFAGIAAVSSTMLNDFEETAIQLVLCPL